MMSNNSEHYLRADIARLLGSIPKMTLAKPERALAFLKNVTRDGHELKNALACYPQMRIEPLDFHYVCLQSLGALNAHLISDLTKYYGWHGIVWASLIAALAPSETYAPYLTVALDAAPHNQWIVQVALGVIEGRDISGMDEHTAIIQTLRAQLSHLSLPATKLRTNPTAKMAIDTQARVRDAYRRGGVSAALYVLNSCTDLSENL